MAQLITTTNEVKEIQPRNGSFSLKEMQKAVGGYIEIISLPNGKEIVCNEEGKLIGLPINQKATELWKKAYPLNQFPFNNDELVVGDILFGDPEEFGKEK